jgi:hypothetical protein
MLAGGLNLRKSSLFLIEEEDYVLLFYLFEGGFLNPVPVS